MKILTAISLACVVLGVSGCGSDSDAAPGGAGKPSGAAGEPTLAITAPGEGASVQLPFTLKFTTSEEIGPEDSGKDHVHVVIDGKTDDYTVVTSTTYQVKSLPAGRHMIGVTLQHADHSSAGASAKVNVNVTGGGPSGGTGDTGGSGGYSGTGGYGY